MRVDSGIVPATAVVPVETASITVDSAEGWIVGAELRGSAGNRAICRKRDIRTIGTRESGGGTGKQEWQ